MSAATEAPAPAANPLTAPAHDGLVTVYGASDDLVEVEGNVPGCDEYDTDDAVLVLIGGGKTTLLRVQFQLNGCWAIAVSPQNEQIPMHEVLIVQGERGYTALATVRGVEQVIRQHG